MSKKNEEQNELMKRSKLETILKVIVGIGIVIFLIIGFNYKGEVVEDYKVEINVKDYGTIYLTLDGEQAPITVKNFVKLAKEGFYDGLTFHRVIDGFMIQGGDPDGDGTGGSSETIKGEFSSNGVDNTIKHERGVISMARSKAPDSASSQFFIVHKTSAHLDGNYAAFGKVTKGMEVVDKIVEKVAKKGDGNGMLPEKNQPVIESIKIIEEEK